MPRLPSTDRKQEILDAAIALFHARGLASVSTRDLADHVGLSRSHVYHYFSDWNALRLAAFESFAQSEVQAAHAALGALPPHKALKAFVEFCLPARRDAAWTLWVDAWDEALRDPPLAAAYEDALAALEQVLGEVVERGMAGGVFFCEDGGRVARQVMALVNGYADSLLLKPTPKKAHLARQEVLQAAARLLGPP